MLSRPILCLDFDGVLHSYTSGWQGADVIADPPVDGAMLFLAEAVKHFRVAIYSSRSGQEGGIDAMKNWLVDNLATALADGERFRAKRVYEAIEWPREKPPAMITIDDRALTFDGTWPSMESLLAFQPWNKRADIDVQEDSTLTPDAARLLAAMRSVKSHQRGLIFSEFCAACYGPDPDCQCWNDE